ncbi:MAG: sigma-70 family RNA polymerase sigma factor [Sphingobacteriales bacterium]|nr:sigma-70 family RNA polymerase sigma factor [Sphingobacteriales bacterium]
MEITTINPKLMMALSDKELVEALQKEKTKEGFDSLFKQFFNRFKGYVFKVTLHFTRNFSDAEDLAKDITQETFRSISESKAKFKVPINTSDEEYTARVKGWLGKSAKNHFRREYARRINIDSLDEILVHLPEPAFDLFEELYPDPEIAVPNEFRNKLNEALSTIKKERDKHILLEYALDGCIETGKHLTTNTMEYLCKLYDTTPENIRQIKKRTYDKIKTICLTPNNS